MNNIINFPTTLTLTATNNPQKKRYIHKEFARSYTGPFNKKVNVSALVTNPSMKFCIGSLGNKEAGYLVNNDFVSSDSSVESFSYCELAVVKKKYRSNGVLKDMLNASIKEHDIKGIELTESRAVELQGYYKQFGFTFWIYIAERLVILVNPSVVKNHRSKQLLPSHLAAPVTMHLAA